jgi:hypothetical protein
MVICPGPLVMIPLYFIKSRGWKEGLPACGFALAFLIVQCGIYFLSLMALQGGRPAI